MHHKDVKVRFLNAITKRSILEQKAEVFRTSTISPVLD